MNNLTSDVPESQGPDGLETPSSTEERHPNPWSRLILQVLLKVHRAQANIAAQLPGASLDLAATAESRESGHADGAVKYCLHSRQQLQARRKAAQGRTPTLRPSSQRVASLPLTRMVSAGDLTHQAQPCRGSHAEIAHHRGRPTRGEGDGRSPWGTSVTHSNGSFLLCEAREGWDDSAQTHCDTPGFWHQAALPVDKRGGLFHEHSGSGPQP